MVHEAARVGFQLGVGAYERGRPSYPPDAIEWLRAQMSPRPDTTVADLAAGTGKLTRLLQPWPGRLVAIEPVEAMRASLAAAVPRATVVGGVAEAIPLVDGSVHAVTVAQAFHWFDGDHALAEIRRVLRREGRLAVLYNARVPDDPVNIAVTDIVEPHRGDAPSRTTGLWREPFERSTDLVVDGEASFPNVQLLDADGLVDRVCSTSVVAALDPEGRADVERRVREIARRFGEPVRVPYSTDVYVWRTLSRSPTARVPPPR